MRRLAWPLLLICLGLGLSHPAGAAPWQTAPGLLPDDLIEKLKQRFPSIESAQDLEGLLREVGRRGTFGELRAEFRDSGWVIVGSQVATIDDIVFLEVPRELKQQLIGVSLRYSGQADSPEVRRKLRASLSQYMARRGYPRAIVDLKVEGRKYLFSIERGEPCVISEVQTDFGAPAPADLGVARGELCDEELIAQRMAEFEDQVRKLGYNQIRIDSPKLNYDPTNNVSKLMVVGKIGQRVRYEIDDTARRFIIDDIFSSEELTDIDPSIVGPDAMASELERRYRNRGFLDVEVVGPKSTSSGDELVYRYQVNPGTQYFLRDLQFEGVTALEEENLPAIMDLYNFFETAQPYNVEEVKNGIDLLKAKYQEEGYWDAEIRDPGFGSKDKETASVRLTIVVKEGRQRLLKDIIVKGAANVQEVLDIGELKSGEPLDRAKIVEFQQAIRTYYLNRGYLYAEVEVELLPTISRRAEIVDVQVTIREGERVKIGDISILGLNKTHAVVVERELLFAAGEWYDPELLNATRQRLNQLGLFQSVQISPADRNALSEQAKELDLVVEVREASPGNVNFGPGWSLYKGFRYGAEASYSNIGGMGRQVSMRSSISEEKQQAAIGPRTLLGRQFGVAYLEPYVFDLPLDGSIGLSHFAQATDDFWELSYGGEVALTHTLRRFLIGSRLSTFFGQKITREEGAPEKEDELISSNVRIGRVGIRYKLDRRDSQKFPTKGFTFDTEQAWARYELGGDLRYFRWDVTNNYYFSVFTDWVMALGIELTSYEGIQRKSTAGARNILPPSERLFAGGTDSVRGYRARRLGPLVRSPDFTAVDGERVWNCGYRTNALGGSRRVLVKGELRYKISDDYAAHAFADSGNTFFSSEEMQEFANAYASPVDPGPIDSASECAGQPAFRSVEDNVGYDFAELVYRPGYLVSRHYMSYGAGLSFLLPIGSVNIAYGLPWREPKTRRCEQDTSLCFSRQPKDEYWLQRGELHINVGATF